MGAYLDFIETNFRCGANFVTSGSSIQPGAYSLFHLATVRSISIQISQFVRLKPCISDLYNPLNQSSEIPLQTSLHVISLMRDQMSFGYVRLSIMTLNWQSGQQKRPQLFTPLTWDKMILRIFLRIRQWSKRPQHLVTDCPGPQDFSEVFYNLI